MNKKLIAATTATCFLLPATSAFAAKVLDKKLEIYGKVHLSIDSVDSDTTLAANTSEGISISSNSSRLGFKGVLPAGNLNFIYKIESEISFDEGNNNNGKGSKLSSRNTYAGLKGGFGQIILGQHDTPFKTVASKWGIFGDSVGERRSILGAGYKSGNKLNIRARNAIMYTFKANAITFDAMYAVDPDSAPDGTKDNTDSSITSLSVRYKNGPLWIGVASESYDNAYDLKNGSALRIGAKYKFGSAQVGAFYESIDTDSNLAAENDWNREATGLNVKFKINKATDIRAQYLVADDADNTTDTGASKLSLGVFHKLDKKAQVYVAYGATDNDANAKFQAVDGGHGDEVKTKNGGNPSAISLGLIYKF